MRLVDKHADIIRRSTKYHADIARSSTSQALGQLTGMSGVRVNRGTGKVGTWAYLKHNAHLDKRAICREELGMASLFPYDLSDFKM